MEPEKLIYLFFKAKNYKSSESSIKFELRNLLKLDPENLEFSSICLSAMTELFKSIHDLNQEDSYFITFELLFKWVEQSPDFYQNDLRKAMGPIFIYMYLSMIKREMEDSAEEFYKNYSETHWNQSDLEKLQKIKKVEDDIGIYKQRYFITMQNYSFNQLMNFLESNGLVIVLAIINKHLDIRLTEEQSQAVLLGEDLKAQSSKIQLWLDEDRVRKEAKVPLPNIESLTEYRGRELSCKVSTSEAYLPDIVFHTIRNANEALCIDISEDTSLIACGFDDSVIRVFQVGSKSSPVHLIGHTGAVYSLSISPQASTMISGSEDTTIRLWSLHSCTCLVVYKAHYYTIWSVKFSPVGHYFASGSHDKIVYIWSTDSIKPVRMLVGHYSDILSTNFSPKSTYVATTSSDKTARIWEVGTGDCLRIFSNHTHPVTCSAFTKDGKSLVTGDEIGNVCAWDINKKDAIWKIELVSGIVTLAVCFNSSAILVGTDNKEVYHTTTTGKLISVYKTKPQVLYTGFSLRNLGIVCGITRIKTNANN